MEKNYIVRGVGYIALLAAVIEQARLDAKKGDTDAELGIEEWADIAAADTNFKIYEQKQGRNAPCFFCMAVRKYYNIFQYGLKIL